MKDLPESSDNKLLNIQEAAKILRVSPQTLRRWEQRGILVPQRTAGNQRRYEISQLLAFKKDKKRFTEASAIANLQMTENTPPVTANEDQSESYNNDTTTQENVDNLPVERVAVDSGSEIFPAETAQSVPAPQLKQKESVRIGQVPNYQGNVPNPLPTRITFMFFGILLLGGALVAGVMAFPSLRENAPFRSGASAPEEGAQAAQRNSGGTKLSDFIFRINVPSFFAKEATFEDVVSMKSDLTVDGEAVFNQGFSTNNQNGDFGTGIVIASNIPEVIVQSVTAGSGVTITGTASNPIISTSSSLSVSAGDGISVSGSTVSNADRGSSQNIFKTIAVAGQSDVTADANSDTLTFVAGTGVTLTTDAGNDTLTISSTGGVSSQWTTSGNDIYYTTGNVGIGTTAPLSAIDVAGSASISGNLTFNANAVIGNTQNRNITFGGTGTGSLIFSGFTSCTALETNASGVLTCGNDDGGATGIINIEENDVAVSATAGTIDFLGSDFVLSESPSGEINVSIDYPNSNIVRKDQNETISGNWTFSNQITLGSDTVTDITGTGLQLSGGSLETTLGISIDLTTEVTGVLSLANGGTNKNLTAVNGGIVYSDVDSFEIIAAGISGQILQSTGAGAPTWVDSSSVGVNYWQRISTSLAPLTISDSLVLGGNNTTNHYLEVNGRKTGKALAVFNETGDQDIFTASSSGTTRFTIANNGALTTSYGTGILHSNSSGVISSSAVDLTSSDVTGILPVLNGGTGANTLNDLITLGTHTTGNFLANVTGNSQISVGGTPGEGWTATLSIAADSIGDSQLAFDTGQHLTTTSSPTFNGLSLTSLTVSGSSDFNGDVSIADTSIALDGASTTFTSTGAFTLTPGGVMILGATGQAATLQGSTLALTANGAGNDISLTAADDIIFDDGTTSGQIPFTADDTALTTPTNAIIDAINEAYAAATGGGTGGVWTLSTGKVYPTTISNQVGIGTTTGSAIESSFYLTRNLSSGALGKALAIFDQTENQDIFTASASGTTRFTIANNGTLTASAYGTGIAHFSSNGVISSSAVNLANSDVTGILPVLNGGTGSNTLNDLIALGTHTTGNYVANVTVGNGLSVSGSAGEGWTPSVSLDVTTSGETSTLSSNSGLETAADGLSLLRGCGDAELLKWDDTNDLWECATDDGGATGIINVEENDVAVSATASTLDFLGADFTLTESPSGEVNVAIDYTNSNITRKNQNETISGIWNFSNQLGIGTTSPDAKLQVSGAVTGKALAILNETGDQNILTASASGTTVFNLTRAGLLESADLTLGLNDASATISTFDTNEAITIDPNGSGAINFHSTSNNIDSNGNFTLAGDVILSSGNFLGLGASAGRIEFTDAGTDELEVQNGNLDLNTNLIQNIGDANTDFTSGGGLTLAGALDANGNASFADTDIAFDGASTTFSVTGAFTLTPGGAMILGATGQAATLQGTTLALTSNGSGNDISLTAADDIIFDDGTTSGTIPFTADDTALNTPTNAIIDAINEAYAAATGGSGGTWTLSSGKIYPTTISNQVGIGTTTAANIESSFFVTRNLASGALGKALAIFDQTENQNVLSASASGTTVFNLTRAGVLEAADITLGLNDASATISTYDTDEALTIDPNGTGAINFHSTSNNIDSSGNFTLAGDVILSNANFLGLGGSAGRIAFTDAGTDEIEILTSNLDLNDSGLILNIGNSGTDFTSGGGLNVAGLLDVNGELAVADQDIAFDGANTQFSVTGDLTLSVAGGQVILPNANVLNVGAITGVTYNAFADSATSVDIADGDSDLFIGDELEVNGASRFDGALDSNGELTIADTQVDFDGASTVLNFTGATTLTPGGAMILGATGQTAALQGTTVSITSNGANNDISFVSADDISFDDAQLTGAVTLTDVDTALPNSNTGIIDAINDAYNAATGGGGGAWTLSSGKIYPTTISNQVGIGTTTGAIIESSFYVTRNLASGALGKALAIFNQTEDQDIFSASASGTTRFVISNAGNVGIGTTAPGAALDVAGNILLNNGGTIDARAAGTLTIGGTTQTGLTLGRAGASTAIAGTTIGLTSNGAGNDIAFLSADDISFDDAQLTSPITLTDADTAFSSGDTGIVDAINAAYAAATGGAGGGGVWTLSSGKLYPSTISNQVGVGTTTGAIIESSFYVTRNLASGALGKALAIFDQTENQDIISASASGTTVFNVTRAGTLRMLESSGGAFYGTLSVGDLAADKTFVLPNFTGSSADICLSTGNCAGAGGGITGSGTATQVAFFTDTGVLSSDSNLYFDNTNKLLGIGSTAPVGKLDVSGAVTGKALVILNETGDQNIFTASASGTTVFNLTRAGVLEAADVTLGFNDGNATLTTYDTNEAITIDPNGTGAINFHSTSNNLDANGNLTLAGDVILSTANFFGLGASAGRLEVTDAGTDELEVQAANLDLNANLILNIGDANTDFTSGGGLTLAGTLDANSQVDLGDGGDTFTASATTLSFTSNGASNDISFLSADDISFDDLQLTSPITLTDSDTAFTSGDTAIVDAINAAYAAATGGGGAGGVWSLSSGKVYPTTISNQVGIGTTTGATIESSFYVTRNLASGALGKALAIFDQTEDQAILTASASGTTVFTLGRTGNASLTNSGSSNIDFNLSSSGDFTISDNGTPFATFTDGGVFTVDTLSLDGTTLSASGALTLTPGGAMILGATGQTATLQGTTVSITSNGVNNDITFVSADDISFDDVQLSAPVTLTDVDTSLPNGNTGIIDSINDAYNAATGGGGGAWTLSSGKIYPTTISNQVGIGTTTGANIESSFYVTRNLASGALGKALAIFNQTENQSVISASASGTTVFNLTNAGVLESADLTLGLNDASATISTQDTNEALTIDPNGTGAINFHSTSNNIDANGNFTLAGDVILSNGNFLGLGGSAGRIEFTDAGTDEIEIQTSNLDLNNNLIQNIGDANTDFTSGGGLTLAGTLDSNGNASFADTDIAFDGASTTFSVTGAFTLTPGGAMILGATGQAATLQGTTLALTASGAGNDISLTAADDIIFDDGTTSGTIPFTADDTALNTPTNAIIDAINEAYAAATGGSGGTWTLSSGKIYPATISNQVGIGTTTGANIESSFFVTRNLSSGALGKALAIFDQTENQNVISASASGTTVFNLTNAGRLEAADLTLGLNDASATISTQDTDEALTLDPNGTGAINFHSTSNNIDSSGNFTLAGDVILSNGNFLGLGGSAGRIQFTDAGTDEIEILTSNLDLNDSGLILNIGNSGTDFTSGGGLTLAGAFDANGDASFADTDIAFDGVNTLFTITGDLSFSIGGGQLLFADTNVFAIGGVAQGLGYNAISDSGGATDHGLSSDDDVFVEGDFEVNGSLFADGAFDSNGQVTIADTQVDFDGASTILNFTGATTLTPGGALILGATGQTATLQGTTVSLTSNGANNDISFTSADDISFDDLQLTSPVTLTDVDTALPNSNTGIIDAINDAYNAATGGSGSVWTLSSGKVYPTTISNQVGIGTTTGANIESSFYVTRNLASGALGKSLAIFNQTENADILSASSSGTTRFVIQNSGNVGIGTTAPAHLLHVVKTDNVNPVTVKIQNTQGAGSDAQLLLGTSAVLTTDTVGASLYADRTDAVTSGDTDLQLRTSAGSTMNTNMIVKSNGTVGVGTTAPTSELHVTRALAMGAVGKALAIFDQIENQDILTASASGTTQFTLSRAGNLTLAGDVILSNGNFLGLGGSAGRIEFTDAGTDELEVLNATFDLNNNLITNIGDANTDFTSGGGLTLAGTLDSNGNASFADTDIAFDGASTTFSVTGAFTLTPGGAMILGATGQAATLQGTTLSLTSNGAGNDISFLSADDISFDDAQLSSPITLTDSATSFTSGHTGIVDAINAAYAAGSGGAGSVWTLSSGKVYPTTISNQVGIGTTTGANIENSFYVTRNLASGALGKALAIFNQTESQDIFTASASGTTRFVITNAGNVGIGITNPSNFKVEVAGNIGPSTDSTYDIGSDSVRWANGYFDTVYGDGSNLTGVAGARNVANSYTIYKDGSTYYAKSNTGGTNYSDTSLKTVVESAVTDLNTAGGGSVIFQHGTFDLGTDLMSFNTKNDIVFEGQGIDATIITNSSDAASDTEPFSFTNSKRITIRNLTVSAGGASRGSSDAIDFDGGEEVLVERVKITDSRARGIVIDGKDSGRTADRNIIRDNIITGVDSDGIELLASLYNLVTGNRIYDVTGHGIQITKATSGADQPNKQSDYNTITNNDINNAGQDGININSSDHNQISNNTVLNSANVTASKDGIRLESGDSISCNYNIITGNTTTDDQGVKTQRYGINVGSANCNNTTISNNYTEGNLTSAISDSGTGTQYSQYIAGNNILSVTGNVGIGTTSPGSFKLNVSGNTNITGNLDVTSGVDISGADLTLATGVQAAFATEVGDKILLNSNTYGIGIETNNLTNWSASAFRWRTGGTDVTSGTEIMTLSSAGTLLLDGGLSAGSGVTAIATLAVGDLLAGASTHTFQFDASNNDSYLQYSADDTTGVHEFIRKSRGTTASPSTISSGDDVYMLRGMAYAGSGTPAWDETSRIQLDTEGTISDGVAPGLIRLYTNNAAGSLTQRMTINSAGVVAIDQTEDAIALDISAGGSTADGINLASSATSALALDVIASSLTTGSAARFYSNSADTGTRSLVSILNDNAAASGTTAFRIQQDSTGDIVNFFDGGTQVFTILDGGNVGIGDATPDNPLEILNTGIQLRLSHTDGVDDTTFGVDTNGDLTLDINATGGAGNLLLADADTLAIGGVAAGLAYHAISDSGGATDHGLASDDDLFIEGDLEVNGTLWADGGIDTAFTAGSIVFAGTNGLLAQDNANFFWDDTNDRFGLGTTAPLHKFHLAGTTNQTALMAINGDGNQSLFTASVSGVTKFLVDKAGNVGIGTTAPKALLDIEGATGASTSGILTFRGTTDPSINFLNGENLTFKSSPGGDAGLTTRMTILKDGNVGIGTTAPESPFEVSGSGAAGDLNIYVTKVASSYVPSLIGRRALGSPGSETAVTSGVDLLFLGGRGWYDTTGYTLSRASIQIKAGETFTSTAQGAYISFFTTALGSTTRNEKVRIDPSGNVGIGTTAPRGKLNIHSLAGAAGGNFTLSDDDVTHGLTSLTSSTNNWFDIIQSDATLGGADISGFSNGASVHPTLIRGIFGSTDPTDSIAALYLSGAKSDGGTGKTALGNSETVLGVYNNTTRLLTLLGSGNVGIGVLAPQAKLQIAKSSAPTTATLANSYLHIGGAESAASSYRLISFGFVSGSGTNYPAYMGYITTDTASGEKGALVFGTRNVVSDTTPTERLRITADGNVGVGTTAPGSSLHLTRPLSFGANGKALAIFDQIEAQDIFTASASGTPRFTITNAGGIKLGTSEGTLNDCLKSGGAGAAPTWASCSGSGSWTESGGKIYPTTISTQLGIGTTTGADIISSAYFTRDLASGALGKALAIFNQTENQDILTASLSGTTRFTLTSGGNVLPGADDTQDLGSDTLRWKDLYLGPDTLHIGTSTSDEYAIGYNTTSNYLGFNVNGSGDPEIVFDSSGNLGIGTTGPGAKLDVLSTTISPLMRIGYNASNYFTSVVSSAGAVTFDAVGASAGFTFSDPMTLGIAGSSNGSLTFQSAGAGITPATITMDNSGNLTIQAPHAGASLILGDGSGDISFTPGNDNIVANLAGTGDFLIQDNGTTFAMFTDGGLIGIGTTTPLHKVHLAGTTNQKALMAINGDGNQDLFTASESGTTRFLIQKGGNVGIGTTTTSGKLHIVGTTPVSILEDSTAVLRMVPSGGVNFIQSGTALSSDSKADIQFTSIFGVTRWMTIQGSSGNIGIGTTAPRATLDIVGSASTSASLFIRDASGTTADIVVLDGDDFAIRTSPGGGVGTTMMTIKNNGNVGIGTTNPSSFKLQVNGNIGPDAAPTISTTTQTTTQVTDADSVGAYTSIAIGTDGLPVISHMNSTDGDLMITKCGNASCSSGNTTTQVTDADSVGSFTSIAIGTDGLPVISYANATDGDLMITKCGNASCSSGNTTTQITDADSVGSYTSIAIGTDGLPVISYLNSTDTDLMITKCGNASCSSGNTTTQVTNAANVGNHISIAIGTDGLPVIPYQNGDDGDLMITKCGNASCSSGNTTTQITDADNVGNETSIAIGTDGLPVISHRNSTDTDLMITKCGNAFCSSGNTTTQVTDADSMDSDTYIAIGTDGLPVISYFNLTDGDLVITKCGNASCSSGNITTQITDADSVGAYSSIAIGTDGLPVISYRNTTDTDMMITKCATPSCSETTGAAYSGGSDLGSIGSFFKNVYAAQYWGRQFQIADFADIAENYNVEGSSSLGDIVRVKQGTTFERTSKAYDEKAIGVISTNPGITLGSETGTTPIALAGRVPVNISSRSESIEPGDMITTSDEPGKGMKATRAGMVLGTALESWSPTDPDGQVLIFVNRGFYDPDVYITNTGDVSIIVEQQSLEGLQKYTVKKGDETIERKGLFSDLFAGNVKAGRIDAQEITVGGKSLEEFFAQINGGRIATVSGTLSASDSAVILNEVKDLRDSSLKAQNDILSIRLDIDDMRTQVASVSGRFATLESLVTQLGETSEMLTELLNGSIASSSGIMNQEAGIMETLTVGNSLSVTGRTTLNDLGVTGNITAGVLSINGLQGSVNTVGEPLRLQNLGVAGVDILDGKVKIDTGGNIKTVGTITAEKVQAQTVKTKKLEVETATGTGSVLTTSAGTVTVQAGTTSIDISTSALTARSLVFVTPDGKAVAVGTKRKDTDTFTIILEAPQAVDVKVNWWIVN